MTVPGTQSDTLLAARGELLIQTLTSWGRLGEAMAQHEGLGSVSSATAC